MTSSYLYFIIPIAAVVLGLKCCLLCWRIQYYQRRRQERQVQINIAAARAQAARNSALVRSRGCGPVSLTRIVAQGPDGQERTYFVPTQRLLAAAAASGQNRPPPARGTTAIIVAPEDIGVVRTRDPNMPPSYDQAISGQDRSVKVDEGAAKPTDVEDDHDCSDDVAPLLP